MWPFNRKSRLASNDEVISTIRKQAMDLQKLEAQLELLHAQHKSLRGYVYAKLGKVKGVEESSEDAANPAASTEALTPKEKLRQRAGIVPGKPYPHTN